jgi:hypothetical protein
MSYGSEARLPPRGPLEALAEKDRSPDRPGFPAPIRELISLSNPQTRSHMVGFPELVLLINACDEFGSGRCGKTRPL